MEETITLDGRQFKLSYDRPLTAEQRAQTIAQIRQQTGCGGGCGQPKTLSDWGYGGFGSIQAMATCATGTKASGETITLTSTPAGAIGPYYVRFWRKSAPGAFTELGSLRTVTEGNTTSTGITLADTDFTGAVGDTTAGTPTTGANGAITDPEDTGAALSAGKIRVATTVYDSCPTGAQSCVEYCDVNLACIAPTCNFVVS